MKKTIYSFCGVLLAACLCFSAKANSGNTTNSVCFNDGFYNWNITYTGSAGNYTCTGTVNVDGTNWSVWGAGSFSNRMGDVEFHASNPNADGCQSGYVDSFTYWGNAQIMGNGSGTTFNGGGSWTSYCSGGTYNTGTWGASGPCGTMKSLPYGPAKHAINPNKNTTNSVCFNDGFYNWNITYTDQGSGNYSVTGSLNVDGNTWPVWGAGNFAGKMGTVELHAANPNPDGCVSYSDSFTYWGNAQIMGNGSGTTFMGSGNWTSYCFGGVLFTGTWAAQGPCGTMKSLPYGPAKHGLAPKNSSNTVCFNDGFYNWNITYTDQGSGNYSVTGSLLVDGKPWSVTGSGNFAGHMGTVDLHAHNDNPDGCVSYSDSFTYWGNAQITGNGSNTMFVGSGNWTSYCFGGELFTGTWAAQGPCGTLKSLPYGPAKHGTVFSMKISPNPMKSSSTVSYSLTKQSKVTITVYNYMQQPVRQVVNKTESAGKHSYVIDGSSLTNGVYHVVAIVDGKSYTSSLQVVR